MQTEECIKVIKDTFQDLLASSLNLKRVSAPLYVLSDSGLNDGLNGVESPVSFDFKSGEKAQIVHSLAKWKRQALLNYGFKPGSGIYTDMNAIRRDEDITAIHSYYVDQWDWERVIIREQRTVEFLKETVRKIFRAMKDLEKAVVKRYDVLKMKLPEEMLIDSQELEDAYPGLSAKQREYEMSKKHGAVFLIGVGGELKSGTAHDGRAPDYDDWSLNGDILVYCQCMDIALELSSMGIRVDSAALSSQLRIRGKEELMKFEYHKMIADGSLPLTIGGGIGQSRLCMFMMEKKHIGEVQVSIWPETTLKECKTLGIPLL